jgi:prepilin signal peptidase PulO-like enzyme (type II secretory pathway)
LLPEIGLISVLLASGIWWPESTSSVLGRFVFTMWIVIFWLLMIILITNLKTMILANRILYPLAVISLIYSILFSIQTHDPYYLIGGLAMGFLVAAIFYLLFMKTGDKIIGFGNIRTAVVAGIILGPSRMILCFLLILAMFLVIFLLKLVAGTFSIKDRVIGRDRVGVMWVVAITVCVLFSERISSLMG